MAIGNERFRELDEMGGETIRNSVAEAVAWERLSADKLKSLAVLVETG